MDEAYSSLDVVVVFFDRGKIDGNASISRTRGFARIP